MASLTRECCCMPSKVCMVIGNGLEAKRLRGEDRLGRNCSWLNISYVSFLLQML